MELDPIQNDARRARRLRQLGPNAACALCGLAELDALVPGARRLLEDHHVVGRANDEALTVPLCRNCHALETEGYRRAGVSLRPPETVLHKLAAVLRAVGALLVSLGERMVGWASELLALIGGLDAAAPQWRDLVEAEP